MASPFGIDSLLVVDDSVVQREHAVRLCRALGVPTVHEAANGAEALELLARLQPAPQVLIIDLEMPVMDGVELIQALHERRLDIPFIVASTCESSLVSAVTLMAQEHGQRVERALSKPLTAAALRDMLQRCAEDPARRKPRPRAPSAACDSNALARAIAAGEITQHYQPKVDIRSGLLRGVEVLARWFDPVLGHVPPDCFIPAAEQHGLIQGLTLSVLDQSLAQAARWHARGLALTVAVNLSPRLLESSTLVRDVGDVVARHGLKPEHLMLEITESSLVSSQGLALGTLARLRMQGYGLSIDDYGTGFSSMQQLSRIPFNELKIDRSFVDGAHASVSLRAILRSAIEMAQRLSISSVAEGIETLQDWRLLRSYGCNIGQGWLIGKAMPADDLRGWLKQHQQRLPELRADAPADVVTDAPPREPHKATSS